MLVLSRKEGERLVIGDNVTITVNRINGNRVTLGIEAPREVRIVRGELDKRESASETQNAAASKQNPAEPTREEAQMTFLELEIGQLESLVG
ncbi:Carbon storage regulator [Roseimaritima multifibrata]|uniref:Translational regulator CsrA n=2 Tax=Roseimaritima multifibrata TaxID=1930274 RepID=A0A517MK32_9BACT|nr:Carbon storage regulator [Roseimaritima multifibrata]